MPGFLDTITDGFRTLKRRSSVRRSVRRNNSILANGGPSGTLPAHGRVGGGSGIAASAPPETPMPSLLPQPDYANHDHDKYATLHRQMGTTLQRSATMNSKSATLTSRGSNDNEKNFWDVRGYKTALNRCDDGHELSTKLSNCLLDRARIEEEYAKSLKDWNKKWSNYLNNTELEYGTGKTAWLAMLHTAEEVAAIHVNLSEKLQKTPVMHLKSWLKDKYQKSFTSFKQRNEFEAEFETAQKSWKKFMEKMKKRKNEYYACVKKERSALKNSEMSRANIDKTEEQKRKAEQEHTLAQFETERARKCYVDEIEKLKLYEDNYRKQMTEVFKKTDSFEECRRKKFEETYRECQLIFKEQINQSDYNSIFDHYMNVIEYINHPEDIKWWSDNYGIGMSLTIPQFEEYFG